ncbi:MAG: PEP-CTERM sorting domain-containing protein [Burkholderiales bacterium]|nr:PEP-CTERM sorting domain-containing protein [Burkholderiales bacterium]
MNHIFKAALAGALAFAFATSVSAAQTIRVDFDLNDSFPGFTAFDGSFVANDTNGDGFISKGEVMTFRNNALGEGTLNAFGDFDIAHDVWLPTTDIDPSGYYSLTRGLSTYVDLVQPETHVTPLAVPEPLGASLMLLGLGTLAAMRRRRNAR